MWFAVILGMKIVFAVTSVFLALSVGEARPAKPAFNAAPINICEEVRCGDLGGSLIKIEGAVVEFLVNEVFFFDSVKIAKN